MKRIGMIGGFSHESTCEYYRSIIEKCRTEGGTCPEIVIVSLDIGKLFTLIEGDRIDELADWLWQGIIDLERAGVDFAFISANTPHLVFDRIKEKARIPLISIVESACEYAKMKEYRQVGLLGTKFTMESHFFRDVFFIRNGIGVFVPRTDEIDLIQDKYVCEIEHGKYTAETKHQFVQIIDGMKSRYRLDGIILGCTEFPLLLDGVDLGIGTINTTQVHIAKIVDACLGRERGSVG